MMPMTPSGTRTRSMRMPLGRRQDAMTTPTGSLSVRTASMAGRHRLDAAGIEREPVEEGALAPPDRRFGDILCIGGQDRGRLLADGLGHGRQGTVLLRRRREREHAGGRRAPRGRGSAS